MLKRPCLLQDGLEFALEVMSEDQNKSHSEERDRKHQNSQRFRSTNSSHFCILECSNSLR